MTSVVFEKFLRDHLNPLKPVLLGVSGGPDSLALLSLMLKSKERHSLQLAIAHVDHGWRDESKEEAAQLASLASSLQIPFHLKTLAPLKTKENLEAHCREQRLLFFSELCKIHGYQAVALAHHADDLAETVMKRVFEGAHFTNFVGIKPIAFWGDLQIWRPLLPFSKNEILKMASQLAFAPFHDRTNLDPRFLRARMRTTLIPQLSQTFGKEIAKPLCRLSAQSLEWRDYLDQRIQPLMQEVRHGKMGMFLPVPPDVHKVELTHALAAMCEKAGFSWPSSLLRETSAMVASGAANKKIEAGGRTIFVDRGALFVPFKLWKGEDWKVQSSVIRYADQAPLTGWKNLWNGYAEVFLPLGDYTTAPVASNASYPGAAPISKLWTSSKIPAFLRSMAPVVWKEGSVVHEFLSGQVMHKPDAGQEVVHISLRI